MTGLSPKQANCLAVFRAFVQEHGKSPTIRELMPLLEVASTCTVQRHLEALEKKGHLVQAAGYAYRGYRLTDAPDPQVVRERLEALALAVDRTPTPLLSVPLLAALGELHAVGWRANE